MGVPIEGAGTSTIRIEGRTHRKGATHALHGDYIEAGSWAVVAAITGGTVDVRGVRAVDMEPITSCCSA
jgi:UDP-N-acetylglucosamine 1-carboxyvinyltransferase